MRLGFLVVLTLSVVCISTWGWRKQGTREQGMFEQSALMPHWNIAFSKYIDAMSYADERLWKSKGYLTLYIGMHVGKWRYLEGHHAVHVPPVSRSPSDPNNVGGVEKASLAQDASIYSWLRDRHVRKLLHESNWLGKCKGVEEYDGSLRTEQESERKAHADLHFKHVEHVLSHDNVWVAMRRMSLLDVVDGTTAEKQANAVRRQGVDSTLLRYAGLTLSTDTLTGAVYEVGLPPSLAGIHAQVMRIVPASLMQEGLNLNEFAIPMSSSFIPSGDYVALVYRQITSFAVYTLPPEYQFGGPVVGIMSSSSNSTAIDPSLTPGSVSLPANTYINISLPMFSNNANANSLCAFFASNGSIFVSNLASMPSYCLSSTLGDFALVIKASSMTSPTKGVTPSTETASRNDGSMHSSSSSIAKSSANWKLIVGATCLALACLAFLVAVALIGIKLTESVKRFLTVGRYMGNDEALQDSLVGGSIAPSAAVMRTKPALEIDVAHFSQ